MTADFWIEKLKLLPHPEGGYYRETYRCNQFINVEGFEGSRNVSTAIYFLLDSKNKSHFHRIKSDELWFFHEGNSLDILLLDNKELKTISLGKNPDQDEELQAAVPAGCWFGARLKNGEGYALVSCTVAPGFDFRDFELANKEELKKSYPDYIDIINEMSL